MSRLEQAAAAVHMLGSFVPWPEAHPKRRAYCLTQARTLLSAYDVGQTDAQAAARLIVWWQVDAKEKGPYGRGTAPDWVINEMERQARAAYAVLDTL